MKMIQEIYEFTKPYLATEETTRVKEVMGFTRPITFDLDKVEKDRVLIEDFVCDHMCITSDRVILDNLIFDPQFLQYNHLESYMEIDALNLLLGIALANHVLFESPEVLKETIRTDEVNLKKFFGMDFEHMTLEDYVENREFIYNRLFDRFFHLHPIPYDIHKKTMEAFSEEEVKELLTYWFVRTDSSKQETDLFGIFEEILEERCEDLLRAIYLVTNGSLYKSSEILGDLDKEELLEVCDKARADVINRKIDLSEALWCFLTRLKSSYQQDYPENGFTLPSV